MRFFLLYGILVFGLTANATITLYNVTGASSANLYPTVTGSTTIGNPQIFAGASGTAGMASCPGSLNPDGTCNTCIGGATPLAACNTKAVIGSTDLVITFVSQTASGVAALCDGTQQVGTTATSTVPAYIAGSPASISIPWGQICNTTSFQCTGAYNTVINSNLILMISPLGTAACSSQADETTVSFKYSNFDTSATPGNSLATSSDGIQGFTVFPGDQKAYLDDVVGASGSTLSSTYTITNIDAFYVDTGSAPMQTTDGGAELTNACTAAVVGNPAGTGGEFNNSLTYFSLPLDSTGNITDRRIMDLNNGDVYAFELAIQDDCGNIGFFTDMFPSGTGSALPAFDCSPYKNATQPEQVYGLLEKNQCFIATAAYGSPFADKVMMFKKFRDQILLRHTWGRDFVRFYYTHSPKYADMIRHNNKARAVVRFFLWPLWLMSAIVLKFGWTAFFALLTTMALSLILIKKKLFKAKHFAIFALILLSSFKTYAQDDSNFFDLQDDTQTTTPQKETAPQEPPYTGTENDEFKDVTDQNQKDQTTEQTPAEEAQARHEKYKENYESQKKSDYQETYNPGPATENPNKWKPYSRIPEEGQLKNLSDQDGLFKITKKGEYDYTYTTGPQHHTASVRFGVVNFPNLQNAEGTTFQQLYGSTPKPMIMGDYEWQFFQSAGKLGLKFGSGLMLASGNGQFASPGVYNSSGGTTTQAEEKYNFFVLPNSLSLIYRLDVFPHQWFVPFAEGGADYFTFFELRDDSHGLHYGGSALVHFAVGGSFLLDIIDREAAADLNLEYGVHHMWLTAEYRRFQHISGALDFSDNLIDAGITFDF